VQSYEFCIKEKEASPSQWVHSSSVITSVANAALRIVTDLPQLSKQKLQKALLGFFVVGFFFFLPLPEL